MSCSCAGRSCNCLERCCCPSEFCVCIACFNLRTAAVVKNEVNNPFKSVSNALSDSQKSDVTNTDSHLEYDGMIQISSSSCEELESDVVFIGSYNINGKVKKCGSPSVIFPEIVLSGSEYEPVFTDGEKDIYLKITPENINRSRNLKGKDFCPFSNKGTISKRKRRTRSWNNRKYDRNSYQGFRKKANISRCQNRSHTSLEQHEDIVVLDNVNVQVNEDNVIENSNFNRYFSEASSSCGACNSQENETAQESPVSNIRNLNIKSKTNRYINGNNVIESSNFNGYISEASSSCSAYKSQENETVSESPFSNIRNNSLKSEINRCINENNVAENSNFKRYFPERFSSWNAYNAQKNEITQETPVSNFRNNSLKFETNRYVNENNFIENSNFNRYFSEGSSSWNAYNVHENEITQEIPVSSIGNNSPELETNRYGLFTHESHLNRKKRKSSGNNSRSAQNGKKMFSEMATFLQPDEGYSSSSFGQQTVVTSAMATVMQTNKDSVVKSSTFHRNCQENFPDVSVCNFDEKDIVRNLSDQSSLTHLTSHKRHVKSDNSSGLIMTVHPAVNHLGYSENNSLQNIDEGESGCKATRKNKHVSFLLPSSHSSSESCNEIYYKESNRNYLQNTDDGESDYKAVKKNKHISFMNPSCHSSSENFNDCQVNYTILKKIRIRMRKSAKRRYKKKRTCPINEFTGETMPTISKVWRKRWRRKRNISYKVGQDDIGNKMKKRKIYIKRETTKENGFVKTEINHIKREIKKE